MTRIVLHGYCLPLATGVSTNGIIESTKDVRPIYWLVEKFIQSPDAQRTQAIAQLAELMPTIQGLVEASMAGTKVRK